MPARPKAEEESEPSPGGGSPPQPQRITESFPFSTPIQLSRRVKPRSERVLLDGEPILRGYHYEIDYDKGLLRVITSLWGERSR